MDQLLSLSQAARMVGVRRKTLQALVQEGRLRTFEGAIRMSELLKEFPKASPERSGMVEKMLRIQDGALFKFPCEARPDAEQLAAEIHRLRLELGETRMELEAHRQLAEELKDRLYDLQDQCDKRESVMLGALITWLARRMSQTR